MASSEWDDTGNTEATSGSVSETWSQASSSHSDLSAKDILGNMAESSAGQGIQHVCNVCNMYVSCIVHKMSNYSDKRWPVDYKIKNLKETWN